MQQIDFIRKLTSEGHTEKEIEEQLQIEFGHQAFKKTAIYKHMAFAKLGVEPPAKEKMPSIRIDTQLLNCIRQLLDEKPWESVRSIANKLNSAPATVYRYLTQHLHLKYTCTKWIPHILNQSQKDKRAQQAEELSHTLRCCKHYSFRNIVTGDQSWFCIRQDVSGAWIADDEEPPICESDKFSSIKIMITVIWNIQGFHIIDFLPEGMAFNSEYMIEHILTPLAEKKHEIWGSSCKRKMWLHLDNCRVHNSKMTTEAIENLGFKRAPHPPYSPDLAPSDFFLFGYTKNKLKGHHFESVDELIDEIKNIFSQISYEKRKDVFKAWIKRCDWVAANGGEYYP